MLSRSFIENSAPDLYLLRIVYIICQNSGVLVGNGGMGDTSAKGRYFSNDWYL
jgi:hypothetical protein